MLFRGTEKYEPYDVYTKKWGALSNASTSSDRTEYHALFPKNFLKEALEVEADRMRHADFREKTFEIEKEAIKSERKKKKDDNVRGAFFELMFEVSFRNSYAPYSGAVLGTQKEIAGLTRDDAKNFYDTYYYPVNSVLVVSGNFEKKRS